MAFDSVKKPAALIVCLSRGFGGADVRVHQIAAGLESRADCHVAVLTGSPLAEKLKAAGVSVIEMGRSRADPRLLFRLVRLMRVVNCQVVDAHNPQSQFWALLAGRMAGPPTLLSSVHHVYGKSDGGPLKRLLYTSVLRLNRSLGCRFMAVSREIMDDLLALGIEPLRITQSDNAVPPLKADMRVGAALREELGWDQGEKIVGIFGRLAEQKGHRYLFDSLARLRPEMPKLRCLVVGTGPLEPALARQVADLALDDIVHFTGFRSDVPDLMQTVDVIAQPSLYEGLPYTVLEAAGLAKPMILTSVGGIPDHFRNGETALLHEPGDVETLCRHLRWCLDQPKEADRVGRAAKRLVEERFSLRRILDDTSVLYGFGPEDDGAPLSQVA